MGQEQFQRLQGGIQTCVHLGGTHTPVRTAQELARAQGPVCLRRIRCFHCSSINEQREGVEVGNVGLILKPALPRCTPSEGAGGGGVGGVWTEFLVFGAGLRSGSPEGQAGRCLF